MEDKSGAISCTSSHHSNIPRRDKEQPAGSQVLLGEKKRQQRSGIEICGSTRVGTISDCIGSAGQRGIIGCPST